MALVKNIDHCSSDCSSRVNPACCGPPVPAIPWQRAEQTAAGMFCLYPRSHYQDASALLGFAHNFISRTDYLLDAGSIFHIFHHSCIRGGVINLPDRCLPRRYKQPNNRVCSGCDGSRCSGRKKQTSRCLLKMKPGGISSLQQIDSAEGLFTDYSSSSVLFWSTAEPWFTFTLCRGQRKSC